MTDFRPFRNTDPPALCEIWRQSDPLRGCFEPLTPSLLEATVFCKPFFDPAGLIVALDDGQPIGFAHAGFAPNTDGSALDTSIGATCMIKVMKAQQSTGLVSQLLARSEAYLQQRGATRLYGGGNGLIAPFYLGLYGGAAVSGVLSSDALQLEAFRAADYVESGRKRIMHRQLAGFRPAIDRDQIKLKRTMKVKYQPDPSSATWWEACTLGLTDRFSFSAHPKQSDEHLGRAVFWDMEPLASYWGVHARGLCELTAPVSPDRPAHLLYLIGESMRLLAASGATLVEVHLDAEGDPLMPILSKMGFHEVEQTVELVKG